MTTQEMASEYRLAQWAEKLREQKASGQSIRQWCEENGISRQRYFYWQRKLRQAVSESLPSAQTGLCPAPGFVQVVVAQAEPAPPCTEPVASGLVQIEVRKVRLSADASYPAEQLARLVRELAGLC